VTGRRQEESVTQMSRNHESSLSLWHTQCRLPCPNACPPAQAEAGGRRWRGAAQSLPSNQWQVVAGDDAGMPRGHRQKRRWLIDLPPAFVPSCWR